MNIYINRIQSSFTNYDKALDDSLRIMTQQNEHIEDLEKQLSDYKVKDYTTKSKRELIEQIVKDYFSNFDSDIANQRIHEANEFLKEKVLIPQAELENREMADIKLR